MESHARFFGAMALGFHLCDCLITLEPFYTPAPAAQTTSQNITMPHSLRADPARAYLQRAHKRDSYRRQNFRATRHRDSPVISAREPAKFAHEFTQLLALRVILVFFADLYPRALLEEAVAGVHTLLNHMAVELPARCQDEQ